MMIALIPVIEHTGLGRYQSEPDSAHLTTTFGDAGVSGNALLKLALQAGLPGGLFHLLGFDWNLFPKLFVTI
jgi:hypothetical protein